MKSYGPHPRTPIDSMTLYPWPLPPAPTSKAAHSWYDALIREPPPPSLQVKLTHPDAIVPAQSYPGGGWLLHASPVFKGEEYPLHVHARMSVPTALQIEVPMGYMATTLPLPDMRSKQQIDVIPESILPDGPVDLFVRVTNKSTTKRIILPHACIGRLVLVRADHGIPLHVVKGWDEERGTP